MNPHRLRNEKLPNKVAAGSWTNCVGSQIRGDGGAQIQRDPNLTPDMITYSTRKRMNIYNPLIGLLNLRL